MPLLKNGSFGADLWRFIDDENPIPAHEPIVLSLARLTSKEGQTRLASRFPTGVILSAGEPVEDLAPWLDRLALIALEFPKFSDGRAFSSARILREHYKFQGEIRAVGDVLVDQYQFMLRCGFDSFEIAEGRPLESWTKAKVAMSIAYQHDDTPYEPGAPSSHGPTESIFEARRHALTTRAA